MPACPLAVAILALLLMSCGGSNSPTTCSGVPRPASRLILHTDNGIPGQYIVVFFDSVSDIRGTAIALTAKYSGTLMFVYETAPHGFALKLEDVKAPEMSEESAVCWVEQDQMTHG